MTTSRPGPLEPLPPVEDPKLKQPVPPPGNQTTASWLKFWRGEKEEAITTCSAENSTETNKG
jgi:hypothetical protein